VEYGIVWLSLWLFPSVSKAVPHKTLSILPSFKHATEPYLRYVSLRSIEISKNLMVLVTPSLLCSVQWAPPKVPQGLNGGGIKLTTRLHLVLGLINNGRVTPPPLMPPNWTCSLANLVSCNTQFSGFNNMWLGSRTGY
jgi:hypothetical protein